MWHPIGLPIPIGVRDAFVGPETNLQATPRTAEPLRVPANPRPRLRTRLLVARRHFFDNREVGSLADAADAASAPNTGGTT